MDSYKALLLIHIHVMHSIVRKDSSRPVCISYRLRQTDMHVNWWKNRSVNCAIGMWNQRNTMFAIALAFITEGDNTIASWRQWKVKSNDAWDCSSYLDSKGFTKYQTIAICYACGPWPSGSWPCHRCHWYIKAIITSTEGASLNWGTSPSRIRPCWRSLRAETSNINAQNLKCIVNETLLVTYIQFYFLFLFIVLKDETTSQDLICRLVW